ncbi:transcriptional regulator of heat shock gene [Candidatus Scalindua japonica]|uniref:Transcriptional regulator of heat shock protein n=1 Tax=Candidatus Scalindua japonica TaxID=1284222 RepID=A0A286TZM0_9BACT|nr:hypothetical protein [Candidatus Scalindua japonica]GAX61349.1 transcriptional regulator of heat shock gene [Candidatus Scalindua japonica]
MSITTDAVDEFYANAVSSGIDMDDRLKNGVKLLVQLTEPKAIKALSLLLKKMESLEPLLKSLDSLPNTLAIIVDSFDDMYNE